MLLVETIRQFVLTLDRRELYKYFFIFWVIFLLITGLLLYSNYAALAELQRQLKVLNKQRDITRRILRDNEGVKKQQTDVESILVHEPNFKIKQYMDDVLRELQLNSKLSRETDISDTDLGNGYTEIKLSALFAQLDMKQVTDLLYKIKQNPRIYTKELKIVKNVKSATIDVTLVIATLEAQKTTA